MPLVRLLPERWQKFIHEALKFGLVGGVNTVINYAVFNALALTVFVDGQLKATVVATVVATITSYLMNRHWTYRDRPKSAMQREYALFFLFNGVGLLIELGVLAAAKYGLGVTGLLALNVAKTVGVLLATLFRFWSYRTFVFQPAPAVEPTQTTWAGLPRDEWDTMAGMDPVAELAEAMTELEEEEPPATPPPVPPPLAVQPRPTPTAPQAELAGLDKELEEELAAQLQPAPAPRRFRRR
ncbi:MULTISPECIES: GtrA family protein [unclassified Micromonospora]|uniref:GtrA family protein n=1 Tax=unclassified Micromonospora TaxID=2617518 RepID=UPI00103535F6|nr:MULTISPECIES: GtrA family protein [unclassified Micromonospora]QKW12116.1 GtrA family protein [Verrucosispora sp. NA02020]TBL35108.1 GtrA family protein [Verrucosispora sp. SN26_14.1]